MPMPAITFDYTSWTIRYPEFSAIEEPLAQAYFDEADAYCSNSTCNPAFSVTVYNGSTPIPLLARLLNMLTAHIAWLNAPRDAQGNPSSSGTQPASPLVGTITDATEGSVSVSVQAPDTSQGGPSEAFFVQTKYGFAFWQATAQFPTARYAARPTVIGTPLFGGRPGRLVY